MTVYNGVFPFSGPRTNSNLANMTVKRHTTDTKNIVYDTKDAPIPSVDEARKEKGYGPIDDK